MSTADYQVWKPDRSPNAAGRRISEAAGEDFAPTWMSALGRGAVGRCPICGQSKLFDGYLSVVKCCTACATALGAVPADDAPPWVTMFIALHVLVGLVVLLGRTTSLDTESTILIVLPVALVLCLLLLRPVKGIVIALVLKLDIRREDQDPT